MMFWYSDHMGGWGWVLMTFGMLVFWGLLIGGLAFLIRSVNHRPGSPGPVSTSSTPEQLLASRFAVGEIDEPEYADRLAALHRHVPHDLH